MSSYYPILLDLTDRHCVVIGGGKVAERKICSLLKAGAFVRVISPEIVDSIRQLANKEKITLCEREYRPGDLQGAFLVISATDNSRANSAIAEEACRLNILLNVVDSLSECNFVVPASVIRDNLFISITTSGKSPALAKKIRQEIEGTYGREYGPLLEVLGCCRQYVIQSITDIERRKQIFTQLAARILPEMIQDKNISRIMETVCGIITEKDFPFQGLQTEISKIILDPALETG